jgi:RNA polymerase sigma-70 factor (ECF subfamily)
MPTRQEQLFDEVYRDHFGLMIKTTHAFTLDRQDREDLFQEILLGVWQALAQFKEQAKLSTYVYRVAHSCALNWKRSRKRYQHKVAAFAQELPDLTGGATSTPDRERLRWLYAQIHKLPPVDRTLLLLYLDEVPYTEIAAVTGLSEANIGVRLHRLKQQLTTLKEDVKHEL